MDALTQFPWAQLSGFVISLGYLTKQVALFKKNSNPAPEVSMKDLQLLLDQREGKIMRQVHQILIDKRL